MESKILYENPVNQVNSRINEGYVNEQIVLENDTINSTKQGMTTLTNQLIKTDGG